MEAHRAPIEHLQSRVRIKDLLGIKWGIWRVKRPSNHITVGGVNLSKYLKQEDSTYNYSDSRKISRKRNTINISYHANFTILETRISQLHGQNKFHSGICGIAIPETTDVITKIIISGKFSSQFEFLRGHQISQVQFPNIGGFISGLLLLTRR